MALLPRIPLLVGVGLVFGVTVAPEASAAAGGDFITIESDNDDDDPTEEETEEEVVEVVEVEKKHEDRMWGGLHLGTIITPYRVAGPSRPGKRVTSDQARACLDPSRSKHCGNLRGLDFRVTLFEAKDRGDYPRAIGYFRSGFTAGRIDFEPGAPEGGFAERDARSLSYYTVPLFFGGNIYFLKDLPVRPYGGLGFGFDVLKMQYQRHESRPLTDASARIGFELHAGVEARITNYVALSAEVMQLWSARRKLAGVPDFSNEGLTFLAGVTLAIPTRHKHQHHTVHRTRTVKTRRPTPPANVAPPVPPAAATPPVPPAAATPPVPPAAATPPVPPAAAAPPVPPAAPVAAAPPTPPPAPAAPSSPAVPAEPAVAPTPG